MASKKSLGTSVDKTAAMPNTVFSRNALKYLAALTLVVAPVIMMFSLTSLNPFCQGLIRAFVRDSDSSSFVLFYFLIVVSF